MLAKTLPVLTPSCESSMGQKTRVAWVQMQSWASAWHAREPLPPLRYFAILCLRENPGNHRLQGVPLYEFLRKESGSQKPYVLPVPFFNVLNGGMHSGNRMAFQEFMIAPVGASSLTHAIQIGSEVYQELKAVVKAKFGAAGMF